MRPLFIALNWALAALAIFLKAGNIIAFAISAAIINTFY